RFSASLTGRGLRMAGKYQKTTIPGAPREPWYGMDEFFGAGRGGRAKRKRAPAAGEKPFMVKKTTKKRASGTTRKKSPPGAGGDTAAAAKKPAAKAPKRVTLPALMKVARSVLSIEELRPGQEDGLRHVLAGRDVLAVMPTGSGKSL